MAIMKGQITERIPKERETARMEGIRKRGRPQERWVMRLQWI
jgi:hypothetical protein